MICSIRLIFLLSVRSYLGSHKHDKGKILPQYIQQQVILQVFWNFFMKLVPFYLCNDVISNFEDLHNFHSFSQQNADVHQIPYQLLRILRSSVLLTLLPLRILEVWSNADTSFPVHFHGWSLSNCHCMHCIQHPLLYQKLLLRSLFQLNMEYQFQHAVFWLL